MPVSLNNTQIVFNDATTQTTSGVTSIGTGTGISSTGGKTPTLTNTGVTSVSGAGTVSVSASTGAITITGTGGSGTVTSVATGNGLQGGTITSSGTLSVACPTYQTVGSYTIAFPSNQADQNLGNNRTNVRTATRINGDEQPDDVITAPGTWKLMGAGSGVTVLVCRVS